ncbi:MAG TPA: glycoside hydrolase family 130 protein [Victivallales bacterium]|nr:glycoside hydrolase family 130 protein [Victivallales bacterium]HPO90931.1 glycoside hydrolase family 130 protein [Victivallales bacterium]HRR29150.1 glycoside hydrolase family 130 protein [Victivallales bacterium]
MSTIKRYHSNPILTAKDVPYHATLVFNAGVAKYQGQYVMVFRNDYGRWGDTKFDGTNLGLAFSSDGIKWKVQPEPCWQWNDQEVRRVYDPRITVIEGKCYLCFAVDTNHGVCGGIAVTEDFQKFKIKSLSVPDNRNMVLFPEKISGKYWRLERPFPVYSRGGKDRFDIWGSASPDLVYWGESRLVLAVEQFPICNDKIGPGSPPVKTPYGWLAAIHIVDRDESRGKNGWENTWKKRYSMGLALFDIKDPLKVIGYSREPVLIPEAEYEVSGFADLSPGFRNNVIFPGGMILEDNGEVKIYYGSADSYICLATADLSDLIKLCRKTI